MVYTRHVLLQVEEQWGTIDRWPVTFHQEWSYVKTTRPDEVATWFESIRSKAKTGRQVIGYLAWVMDGDMPTIDEWRDLWLEAFQLLGMMYTGVQGLEQGLELTERWYGTSLPDRLQFPFV